VTAHFADRVADGLQLLEAGEDGRAAFVLLELPGDDR
jgi:hypothetical protein